MGSPNRPLTDEERELLQADLDLVHNEFIDIISEYRGIERGRVVELADGSSMPGVRALDANLVDELGGRAEATEFISTILETDSADISYCEYEGGFVLF
jgi:protease-4